MAETARKPRAKPWEVPDGLWERIAPLLPVHERRFRYPGRKRRDDRSCLSGILFVLITGTAWEHLPQELGYGSGMTCWRRLREWQEAGVWPRLHGLLLAELRAADALDLARAAIDGTHAQAKRGAPRSGRARSTGAGPASSTTSSSRPPASRSPGA
jgi:transposase